MITSASAKGTFGQMSAAIPQTPYALLSGSAGWGLRFPEDLEEPGVRILERWLSFDTPWGAVDNWQLLELDGSLTADGRPRRLLNVFSHGWPHAAIDNETHRKVAWILAQAGVRKVLADSTCGSLNKTLQPRDFVIARDVIDFSQTQHSVMAGRLRHQALATQLFCPSMAQTLERTRGNKRKAASILGVYRPTLYNKLKKYNLLETQERAPRQTAATPAPAPAAPAPPQGPAFKPPVPEV